MKALCTLLCFLIIGVSYGQRSPIRAGNPKGSRPFKSGTGDVITVTITLSGTPNSTTKVTHAPFKYNKVAHFDLTNDDRNEDALDLAAYMTGGVAFTDGLTYSGKTFTDGANNRMKNIKYTGTIATNSWYTLDSTGDMSVNAGIMDWVETASVVSKGWSVDDHGAFHGTDLPGAVALGFNQLDNAAANRNYVFRKLYAQGIEYVMKHGVVPANYPGYHSAWEQLGYLGGISQGTIDGYDASPLASWMNNGLGNATNWINENRYKVQTRRFEELDDSAAASVFTTAIAALISQSTTSNRLTLSFGTHAALLNPVKTVIDYLDANDADKVWVCGLHEFHEYFEVAQQTRVKQTLSGNTLTVVLDQTFLNDDVRWRDMSFLLSSNSSITNVTVTGADDWSYNTTTGLINIYEKKTTGFDTPEHYFQTGLLKSTKIPLEIYDFYQDNNYQHQPLKLIDGNTSTRFEARDYADKMIYSPYDLVVDLGDYGAIVKKIRIYDGDGSGFDTRVILVRNDTEVEDTIGTFTGAASGAWVEYVPDTTNEKFVSSRVILRSNASNGYGNELEVIADHFPYTEQTYVHRKTPLKWQLGVNTHWWDFVKNATGRTTALNANKINGFNSLKFYSIRNYGNAFEYAPSPGGKWAFNPVKQGWFEDDFWRHLKVANPELKRFSVVLGQFDHVKETWNVPDDNWRMAGKVTGYTNNGSWGTVTVNVTSGFDSDGAGGMITDWWLHPITGTATVQYSGSWHDIPTSFPASKSFNVAGGLTYAVGDSILIRRKHESQLNFLFSNNTNAGRSTLSTWDTLARTMYVFSARKGRNANAGTYQSWSHADYDSDGLGNAGDAQWMDRNVDSLGLNTNEWVEGMNEPNAWWSGYDDYLNGNHLATAWSKMYDNHKTASTTLGAKNADTSMQFSHSGLAVSVVDLNRAADYWSKKYRGTRPKINVPTQPMDWRSKHYGWRDNPYDIIQYHSYSYTGGANQFAGGVQSGLAPELSHVLQAAKDFVWFRNKYAPWALVDVGEWGLDTHPESTMASQAIGPYNIEQVRAAWNVRNMLEFNAIGVDITQAYRLYQDNNMHSNNKKDYNFSTTTTDADPGNGFVRRNNSDFYATTTLYIDDLDRLGGSATSFIDGFDNRTPESGGTYRGKIHIFKSAANGGPALQTFHVVGLNTTATGYTKVTVAPQQKVGTINQGDIVSVYFGVEDATQFATMAFLRENEDETVIRRLQGFWFSQFAEFGDYYFDSRLTAENSTPRALRFKKDNTNYFIALWAVEGVTYPANQRPVFTHTTGTYAVTGLNAGDTVKIRRFIDEGDNMSSEDVIVPQNGTINVAYDLKPVFIQIGNAGGGNPGPPGQQKFRKKIPVGSKFGKRV